MTQSRSAKVPPHCTHALAINRQRITSMSSKIRVGIIGASIARGWGSTVHLPALRALSGLYEVTAVCNSNQQSADEAAQKFGIAYAFSDPRQLAQHPEVDLVSIC